MTLVREYEHTDTKCTAVSSDFSAMYSLVERRCGVTAKTSWRELSDTYTLQTPSSRWRVIDEVICSHIAAEDLVRVDRDPISIPAERALRDLERLAAIPNRPPRLQLLVAAQPAIIDRVRGALETSKADWRTSHSLAKELGVSENDVLRAIESMASEVRQPIAARGEEVNYYRLASRGKTWQERVRWLLLAVGGTPPHKIR